MKKVFLILTAFIFFNSCIYTTGYYIDQEVRTNVISGDVVLATAVWHCGEIVKLWECPIENVNDSTKTIQRREALHLIKILEK